MAYEDVEDPAARADDAGAATGSFFSSMLAARSLVSAAEYQIAQALPRRIADAKLAALLGVTPEALHAAFARVTGESTYRSLLKMRVKLVDLTLQARPELSPRAVAQVCGFGYFGRFHQLYRRDTGRSPEAVTARVVTSPQALEQARAAVAATVERVFKPLAQADGAAAVTRAVAPGEARSVAADEGELP